MRAQEFTTEADNIIRLPTDRPARTKTTDSPGVVKPFKGPKQWWQDIDPVILRTVYEWFWAVVKRDSMMNQMRTGNDTNDPFNAAATMVLKLEDKLRQMGFLISINSEGNIELTDTLRPDSPIVMPSQDAAKSSGWAANFG